MEPERFAVSRSRNICTYPQAHWEFSKHDLSWKVHETIFRVDFLDVILTFTQSLHITSILYINAFWRWGLRPPVFDLENRSRGDQLNVRKRGYLTIVELPPFPFSSRVGLRQVFCASKYVYHKNAYSCGLNLFAVSLHFVGAAGYQLSIPTVQKVPGR